jgi:hypothetical protein
VVIFVSPAFTFVSPVVAFVACRSGAREAAVSAGAGADCAKEEEKEEEAEVLKAEANAENTAVESESCLERTAMGSYI